MQKFIVAGDFDSSSECIEKIIMLFVDTAKEIIAQIPLG